MATETTVDTTGLVDDVLSTPELEQPIPVPDVHQGVINAVSLERFETDKGKSTAIKFAVQSTNNANIEDELAVFLPRAFAENININPADLPSEPEGESKFSQRDQYAMTVANSDKTATLQNFRSIAAKAGRTTEGMPKPNTIEEFVEVLNALLTNVEVVFVRKANPKAENPVFRTRLRVTTVYGTDILNKVPKSWKKFRLAWEG